MDHSTSGSPLTARRPRAPFPYDLLPPVPAFTLSSPDLEEGGRVPEHLTALGESTSPALSWSGLPEATRSLVVSCFDPDAPTPSGWWHWMVVDLDASTTGLPAGAGTSDLMLDGAAFHLRNDSGTHAWAGPCPPPGDGEHRYVLAVHALDVDCLAELGVDDESSCAEAAFHVSAHCLARATLTATYSVPAADGSGPTALPPLA